ncbi:MAG: 50S ribosomal protein L9 [Syntrophobacterales bacterium]|jgi:large subunit ribosomal protein L9|nr:50S ribosomal protein L9 [Syntrophobacterales bacterium]
MQVILKEDIGKIGKAGEIVNVAVGYGRNFLVPQGLAVEVNSRNIKMIEQEKKRILLKMEKEKKKAEELASQLASVVCNIARRGGEQGKLFGSVNPKDIEENLAEQGIILDRKNIILDEPIKAAGEYPVKIKLTAGVSTDIKVIVVAEA